MINEAFLDFVCEVCEANLVNRDERASFITCLERAPGEIAKMLAESREGLAIRAENRRILKSRFEVTPSDDARIMESLKKHFLDQRTEDTLLNPGFPPLPQS